MRSGRDILAALDMSEFGFHVRSAGPCKDGGLTHERKVVFERKL